MMTRKLEMTLVLGLVAAVGTGCSSTKSDTIAADDRAAKQATAEATKVAAASSSEEAARDLRDALLSLERVHFSLDSSDILPHSRDALTAAAEQLRKYPDVKLSIDGHADDRGTVEHNLALGDRRARTVAQYLMRLGIPSERLHVVSLGEERPLVEGSDAAALAANRRVDFRLLKGSVRLQLVDGKLVDDAGRPLAS